MTKAQKYNIRKIGGTQGKKSKRWTLKIIYEAI